MTSIPASYIRNFNSNMEDITDLNHYPIYCRKGGNDPKSAPIRRGRIIFDHGRKSEPGKECSNCLKWGVDCIRYPGKFSKCGFCTASDLHPEGMCHLPGEPEPTDLSKTALAKKRKMDSYLDSDSTASEPLDGRSKFQVSKKRRYTAKDIALKLNAFSNPGGTLIDLGSPPEPSPKDTEAQAAAFLAAMPSQPTSLSAATETSKELTTSTMAEPIFLGPCAAITSTDDIQATETFAGYHDTVDNCAMDVDGPSSEGTIEPEIMVGEPCQV